MLLRAVGHFQRGRRRRRQRTRDRLPLLAVVCVVCLPSIARAGVSGRVRVLPCSRVRLRVCVCLRFAGALSFDSTATSATIEKCLLSSVTVTATN